MGDKIVIGPINKGLRTDRTAFVIDNDSFPTLINAYQWRGRVKRKRGTSKLCRLQRDGISVNGKSLSLPNGTINLISALSLESSSSIVPGTINIRGASDGTIYTDPAMNGTLVATGGTGVGGSINYASGLLGITAGSNQGITGTFSYYPGLPVMGLEDFANPTASYPQTVGFDTTYAYNLNNAFPYNVYNVSYYKNPAASGIYPGYTAKTTPTAVKWNGQDYQQFWTSNYQGCMFTTNGVTNPFSTTNIGMQFKPIVAVTNITGGPPAIARLEITGHGLVIGDWVFVNEVVTTTGINFQTGYVTEIVDADHVTVKFPYATIATNGVGGIAQYLTSNSDATKDCLRWYDGDPTNGAVPPLLNQTKGWVNFCPPLSQGSFSISDLPGSVYYLVGAAMIVPYKDFLLFIGPVVQTSAVGSQKYLQDSIIWSQNGTPFYTSSYTNNPTAAIDTPTSVTNVNNPMLLPDNQTSSPASFFEDRTGFGGYLDSGLDQAANTVSTNEDVLLIGFDTIQTRLVYTGNDLLPFNLFLTNSEYGSSSTFSAINLDKGVLTRGSRGFIITTQTGAQRIDLSIPDQVFEVNSLNNGVQRICAQRDFQNEWVYFTYPANTEDPTKYKYPNQTLMYNYRDDSWSILNETYTTYGQFRYITGLTWATVGARFPTWASWNIPWNSGTSSVDNPMIIAGNQQGFVMVRESDTSEEASLFIKSFSGDSITSVAHCLNQGDYIVISGCLGDLSAANGLIYQVSIITDANTFTVNPSLPTGTYLGSGVITRMYVPFIQTKQFPTAWSTSRKTRLGAQQYLFSRTPNGQVTIQIYLSQNGNDPYNEGAIVPASNVANSSLIYSTVMYTCPESTNLGLTPANVNLNLVTASKQSQIWHRMNTSLIGDTVQLGITLSDSQMRDTSFSNQFVEIELHSIILDCQPSQMLC